MKRHLKQNKTSLITTIILGVTLAMGLYIRSHNDHDQPRDPSVIQYDGDLRMDEPDAFLGQ